MKKDNAALFILFSVLTYAPLAQAQLPECEKITTSAVAGHGRYAVFCDGKPEVDMYGHDSFSEGDANKLILDRKLAAQKNQDFKLINEAVEQNEKAAQEGKPLPYPGLEKPEESDGPFSD